MSTIPRITAATFAALVSTSVSAETLKNSEYTSQPSLAQIGVTSALHTLVNGSGIGIGHMDGSAFMQHPDLIGQIALASDYYSPNIAHGTLTASVLVAKKDSIGMVGVAPGSKLYNTNIYARGWDYGAFAYALFQQQNALGANIKVISQSYSNGGVSPFAYPELLQISAQRNSFVIVHAAGNSGSPYITQYWAGNAAIDLGNFLIVGSVNGKNQISTFSTRPGEGCFASGIVCSKAPSSAMAKNFFVVAPGESVMSATFPYTYSPQYGTSLAAPHVAGVVALIAADAKAKNARLTPTQLASIVKESAKDLGAPGVDGIYGWGLVNATAALAPIGPLAPAIVPGQVSFDKYGRPYAVAPVAVAVAPSANSWQPMMMGERRSFSLQNGMSLTTRHSFSNENSSLAMTGIERNFGRVALGLSAGSLIESVSLLGNFSAEPSMTRLAAAEASWALGNMKLAAFYARGQARGFAANAYGFGMSYRSLQFDLVKPLSIISATVPTGLNEDGSVAYATLDGERPWAALLKYKTEF